MTVNWYDLLDVPTDAKPEEIRAAWKNSVAGLDPTDKSFRVFNQAAEVLLDPKRRKAYDAELAVAQAAEAEAADTDAENVETAEVATDDVEADEAAAVSAPDAKPGGWVPPAWLLIVLAAVTALVATATGWLLLAVPSDQEVADATAEAQAAAERAAVPVLSYDYTRLEADQEAAQRFLTSDFRKDYDRLFELVKQNAVRAKAKVTAQVIGSGVVRSGTERVEILLFVNRPTTNTATTEPKISRDQVTLSMENVGGEWLIDDMKTKLLGES
ncbi:DnaJ domain-containing protein [Nocardioides speluncae]|uniref:DnaJ domain-containing protein n=1 Tax=Nocardioides speluncae TaxID=2670337 RepID=UPI000D68AA1F|nr:DnaJ domain-containing protein [Nocardioides speluncae]